MAAPQSLPNPPTATRLRLVALGVAVLTLAGCSSIASPFKSNAERPACPDIAILADAARVIQFRPGPGRDLTDVEAQGLLQDVRGGCQLKKASDGRRTLLIELTPMVAAELGPADTDRKATFDYFVGIGRAGSPELANKQVFRTSLDFPQNVSQLARFDEAVEIAVPLAAEETGRNWRIVLGFQLTPEQLEYNRTLGRR